MVTQTGTLLRTVIRMALPMVVLEVLEHTEEAHTVAVVTRCRILVQT
jgi:hypothetical protein